MSGILKKISDLLKTERKEPRYSAFGDFPGRFYGLNRQEYDVIPIDISCKGIGLLIDPSPQCKDILTFEFQAYHTNTQIQFKVIHVENRPSGPIQDLNKMRRCGLEVIGNEDIDLIKLLSGQDYLMIQE